MYESKIESLPLVGRGKVRDIYAVGGDRLLLVATDRLSAYDVVLPTPIPEKGRVLTELANFWFERLKAIIPNHLTGLDPESVVAPGERNEGLALYQAAAQYAFTRGIIIADTKFEFGLDRSGTLHLIDEALTPDSSRFWPLDTYHEGASPESFDKQYVRNWLDSIGFARKPPAPAMPDEVARKTSEKYQEALRRLTASSG